MNASEAADDRTSVPLRIGIICHPTYGGSGVLASELALSLAERGHSVHLFSYDVPPRLARSSGPVQMHVAQGLPYPLFASTPHDLALVSSILDVHRAESLDIVHAHYALPHAVTGYLARQAAIADKHKRAPRLVTTLHGTDITLVGSDPSYAPLTQFVLEQSDAVTAVSENLARRTRENFCRDFGGRACDISVVRNFVDTDLFRPTDHRADAQPTVVHVSNFRPVKRVPWLVRAFAQAAQEVDARLVLVGDGPEHGACRALVRELGLAKRVQFIGERDALPELLSPADVFALSSSDESFGLSALEAMACGTPVVSTDVGGVAEVVVQDQCGLLVAADDLDGYARALRTLLVDRERARRMGARARQIAVERFARDTVVREYEALYLRTLAATPWRFPVKRHSTMRVHLDHNATTPLRPECLRRWNEIAERGLGNPSSVHASGRAARAVLDDARAQSAAALRVKEDELVYTGGGTEALQIALHGAAWSRPGTGVVVSAVEHAAVLGAAKRLEAQGVQVARVGVDRCGRVTPEAVVAAARAVQAGVVAIQAANNELGTIQPLASIRAAIERAGLRPIFLTDAVQTVGRIPLDLASSGADLAVLSAHKFGGPTGVGILWVRTSCKLVPFGDGEGQEHGLRSGTESVPAIAAAALALEMAIAEQPVVGGQMAANCRLLWTQLEQTVPDLRLNGPPLDAQDRLPNTLNISVDGVDGRTLVARLDLEGLEASAGSACASGSLEPSHVLVACGHARDDARAALRLSLGRTTSDAHVHMAVDILRRTFSSLR